MKATISSTTEKVERVVVEEVKTETVTLVLSKEEANTLRQFADAFTGARKDGIRAVFHDMHFALRAVTDPNCGSVAARDGYFCAEKMRTRA